MFSKITLAAAHSSDIRICIQNCGHPPLSPKKSGYVELAG